MKATKRRERGERGGMWKRGRRGGGYEGERRVVRERRGEGEKEAYSTLRDESEREDWTKPRHTNKNFQNGRCGILSLGKNFEETENVHTTQR